MSGIIFNGVDLETLGVICEKFPKLPKPARKYTRYSVPGRSGDIIIPQDAWENVIVEYDVYMKPPAGQTVFDVSSALLNALSGAGDYAVLSDDYDPGHFRRAIYLDGADISNFNNLFGRTTLRFECKPQRFITSLSGVNIPVDISSTYRVTKTNAGIMASKPYFALNMTNEQNVTNITFIMKDNNGIIASARFGKSDGVTLNGMTLDFESMAFKLANGNLIRPTTVSNKGKLVFTKDAGPVSFSVYANGSGTAAGTAVCDTRAFDL